MGTRTLASSIPDLEFDDTILESTFWMISMWYINDGVKTYSGLGMLHQWLG